MTQASPVPESIKETIRKCLSLGDSSKGATEAEAEAAITMAKKLMAKYNLQMSDVKREEEAKEGAKEAKDTWHRATRDVWERSLAWVCVSLFNVEHYITSRKREDGRWIPAMSFIGVGSDAALAAEAYTILMGTVRKMMEASGYKYAEGRSYAQGIVDTLQARAKEAVKGLEPSEEEKCRSIVVVKNQLIKAHKAKLGLVKGRATGQRNFGSQAYGNGREDGKGVSLNFRNSLEGK